MELGDLRTFTTVVEVGGITRAAERLHVDLTTTNRCAQINTKAKMAALRACEPVDVAVGSRTLPNWQSDEELMDWLTSL